MRQRSHRLRSALRRQAGHAVEDVGGRLGDLLHLVDRLCRQASRLQRGLIGGAAALRVGRGRGRARGLVDGGGDRRWCGLGGALGAGRQQRQWRQQQQRHDGQHKRGSQGRTRMRMTTRRRHERQIPNSAAPCRDAPRRSRTSPARGRGNHEPVWQARCQAMR